MAKLNCFSVLVGRKKKIKVGIESVLGNGDLLLMFLFNFDPLSFCPLWCV